MLSITRLFFPRLRQNPHHYEAFSVVLRRTLTAGQRSAILYSLVVSCERHGKNPYGYLRDVLTRLPAMTTKDDLAPLLPANWKPPVAPLLAAAL